MKFDYYTYLLQNCTQPIVRGAFFCVLGSIGLVSIIRSIRKKQIQEIEEVITDCLFFLVCSFLLIVNLIPLCRGGIFLLHESESDAVCITGTVEKTGELGYIGSCKYDTDNNDGQGETITVGKTLYYIMTYGDIKEGDIVVLRVLPRSKIVLQIEKQGEAEPADK